MRQRLLITSALFFISLISYSQGDNELRLYYGISDSELLRNDDLIGAGNNDVENLSEIGVRYLRKITANFEIGTGINYATADLIITPHFTGVPVQSTREQFSLISIPLYANYTLWNFFFIQGGPLLDLQISENTANSQSGIGYSLGVGGKYNFRNFVLFLNPNFKRHAVIPFEKENYHQKLTEFGIQIGLGYNF